MGLSEERKRQIREEEEAILRAQKESEQQYREQVRRELEEQQQTQLEQQYRDDVRAELSGAKPVAGAKTADTSSPPTPEPTLPAAVKPSKRKSPFLKRAMICVFVFGGLVCIGLAFDRGFVLPFAGPAEITLRAETSGEPELVDEIIPSESIVSETTPAGAKTTGHSKPQVRAKSAPQTGKRANLQGTGISIEIPTGWVHEKSDLDGVIEIRWRDSGIDSGHDETAAYVLLQKVELRRGESLENFAERLVEEFLSGTTLDEGIDFENDAVIENFHGVGALSIDIVARGYLPYRMRNYYWIKDGNGYMLSCYGAAGTFEDRAPAFNQMIKSIRLSSEGR